MTKPSANGLNLGGRPVALITGAANGIGRQLAVLLAHEGWSIAAIDKEPLDKLVAELAPESAAGVVADVTDRIAMVDAATELQLQLGPIELLIAGAGVGFETSALTVNAADIETIVRVNLIGVSNSIAAVLPGMIERGRGHLVALSSLASYRGLPRMAGYCASKAGVNALMEAIRAEVKPLGIAVTTICPGWVLTDMTAHLELGQAKLMTVEFAARCIHHAIRKRQAFYAFPGGTARRLAMLRWLPASISDWVLRRALRRLAKK